jgi:hypothetical protein
MQVGERPRIFAGSRDSGEAMFKGNE